MASDPPHIPPEICDQIIDHLWNDLPTLKACSLTCHSWLPATRVHIFHTLDVRSDEDFREMEEKSLHKYDGIAGWVRTLVVSDLIMACVFLTALRNVSHLNIAPPSFLDNCFGVALDSRMEHWQRSGFPTIKSIQMIGVVVDRTDMEIIPSIFPNISSLSTDDLEPLMMKRVENETLARMDNERQRGTHPVPELNVVSRNNINAFWTLRVVDYEKLWNLEIPIKTSSDAASVCSLLKRAAYSPRSLTLNLWPPNEGPSAISSVVSQLQVPPDTPIRTLCLFILDCFQIQLNTLTLPLLSRFPSPSLTHIDITLVLRGGRFADVAIINWLDLDAQLTHMADGTSLAKVVVRMVGTNPPSERLTSQRAELDRLTGLLPHLCASGIHVGIQYDGGVEFPLIERWFCRGKVYREDIGTTGPRRETLQAWRREFGAKILSHADSCGNESCTYASRSGVSTG